MDEMLGAMYLNNQFDLGQAKGELNGWKNKARKMSNDYRVLHRDWHERTLIAISWRRVAEDLYKRQYKKLDKEATVKMFRAKLAEAKDYYRYDPNQKPGS